MPEQTNIARLRIIASTVRASIEALDWTPPPPRTIIIDGEESMLAETPPLYVRDELRRNIGTRLGTALGAKEARNQEEINRSAFKFKAAQVFNKSDPDRANQHYSENELYEFVTSTIAPSEERTEVLVLWHLAEIYDAIFHGWPGYIDLKCWEALHWCDVLELSAQQRDGSGQPATPPPATDGGLAGVSAELADRNYLRTGLKNRSGFRNVSPSLIGKRISRAFKDGDLREYPGKMVPIEVADQWIGAQLPPVARPRRR